MTPTTSLHILLVLLLSASNLATGSRYDLVNPALQPNYICNPDNNDNTVRHPVPLNCALAITQFPDPARGVDWHRNPHGEIVYNRPLTSTGDRNADNHLPRAPTVGGCQVKVELRPGVQSANVVWADLGIFAMMLVRRCVGDERVRPAREGPGTGGVCEVDGVRITVASVGLPRWSGSESSSSGSTSSFPGAMDTMT